MKNSIATPLLVICLMLLGLCLFKIKQLESFVGIYEDVEAVKLQFNLGLQDAKANRPPASTESSYMRGYSFQKGFTFNAN